MLPFALRFFRKFALLVVLCAATAAWAQNFVRVSDPANEAAVDPGDTGYTGCAWIDYDNDGDEDLFVNRDRLYRNDGEGVFARVDIGVLNYSGLGSGCSWADFDNDGDPDLYVSGAPHCVLYRNDGNNSFIPIEDSDIDYGLDIRGWSCAWGDYDSDGSVDLIVTHPGGFLGNPALHNLMFHNDGPPDYGFTRVTGNDITSGFQPFTVGSWADYDLDGDLDFFIGTGPVGSVGFDYLYHNSLIETGSAELTRITTGLIAETQRDGQNINWIDYDNDGDLDCYITNYQGGVSAGRRNDLYRNDGAAGFTAITEGAIVTDRQVSLGNAWGDFDNDGKLDCIVANESGTNKYYRNNGDGSFTSLANAAAISGAHRCPAAADYDNDGDLDLFISGVGTAQAFLRNDLDNGNFWLKVKCVGSTSNRSGIGAIVRVKAVINGETVWQLREINTQNSFNGHSSLIAHFGMGDATITDTLEVRWPGGQVTYSNLANTNQLVIMDEAGGMDAVAAPVRAPDNYSLAAYPNPFNSEVQFEVSGFSRDNLKLTLYNLLGEQVAVIHDGALAASRISYSAPPSLASGVYLVHASDQLHTVSQKLVFLK